MFWFYFLFNRSFLYLIISSFFAQTQKLQYPNPIINTISTTKSTQTTTKFTPKPPLFLKNSENTNFFWKTSSTQSMGHQDPISSQPTQTHLTFPNQRFCSSEITHATRVICGDEEDRWSSTTIWSKSSDPDPSPPLFVLYVKIDRLSSSSGSGVATVAKAAEAAVQRRRCLIVLENST